ncbi:MAG: hypothetical protein QOF64_304 [Candidatus Binatota bacterium]|nr:hypothetical protein [Candidatus Binatota bacterium]
MQGTVATVPCIFQFRRVQEHVRCTTQFFPDPAKDALLGLGCICIIALAVRIDFYYNLKQFC